MTYLWAKFAPLRWVLPLFLSLTFFLLPCFGLNAQSDKQLLSLAQKHKSLGNYSQAVSIYEKYLKKNAGNRSAMTDLAGCYVALHDTENAKKIINSLNESGKGSPELTLTEAECLHFDEQYEAAKAAYRIFLKKASSEDKRRRYVADQLIRCQQAINIRTPLRQQLIENLGAIVNSSANDVNPIVSPTKAQRLYFSTNRVNSTGGLRNQLGEQDIEFGRYANDMCYTEIINNDWSDPTPLPSNILNTARNERLLGFNTEGTVMYYFRGFNDFSGYILTDTFQEVNDLNFVSTPAFLPFSPTLGEQWPFFFNDTVLIFSGLRAEGFGGYDLYVSVYTDNKWSKPENLGPQINSPYDEVAPFLAADGRTLFFSSNSLQSIGGFDVFYSVYNDSLRAWPICNNLGRQVNSASNELSYTLTHDGMVSYFASDRAGGFGGYDLYTGFQSEAEPCQLTLSHPSSFAHVQFYIPERNTGEHNPNNFDKPGVPGNPKPKFLLPTLNFVQEEDVTSGINLKAIHQMAEQMKKYPNVQLLIIGHTDYSGNTGFDLYYTIKRLERVAKVLTEQGVAANRILLRSCGSNYPVAQAVNITNVESAKLNRRIDFEAWQPGEQIVSLDVQRPVISENNLNPKGQKYLKNKEGLKYRVQIATLRRVYDGTDLSLFQDPIIESAALLGQYNYMLGNFETFAAADAYRNELLAQNEFKDILILATINDVPLNIEEGQSFIAAYPDLKAYLAYRNIKKR